MSMSMSCSGDVRSSNCHAAKIHGKYSYLIISFAPPFRASSSMPRHPVDDAERAKSGRALVRLVHSHPPSLLFPQSTQAFLCKGERALQNSTTLITPRPTLHIWV